MTAGDPYQVLGLKRGASTDEVRKAYKRLARKYHPDVNSGDKASEERFKAISEAHAVLSDPEKRQAYDQFGAAGARGPAGFDTSGFTSAGFSGGGLGDLFAQMFSGGVPGAGAPQARGASVEASLSIDFLNAVHGLKTPVRIQRQGRSETIQVSIPAGVTNGTRLRISGHGHPGPPGTPPGDLHVVVKVGKHPVFTRKGNNIYCQVPVTMSEAALGARIQVPTVDGASTLSIPAGSRSGQKLRLKGKGAPSRRGGRGDQFIVLTVLTPDIGQEEVRRLMEELGRHLPPAPRDELLARSRR
jgi:DnaJ-class molecular chaperone